MPSKEPSFSQVVAEAGFPEHSSHPDIEDLKKLISEGRFKSAYSHVRSLDDFGIVRWVPFHNYDGLKSVKTLLERGVLSLEEDSLGVLLQTANYGGKSNTISYELGEFNDDEEAVDKAVEKIAKELGLKEENPAGVWREDTSKTLVDFVQRWSKAQRGEKRWNPSYAPVVRSKRFYEAVKGLSPGRLLGKLRRYMIVEDVHPNATTVLPVDGWTLAECFRRYYKEQERK